MKRRFAIAGIVVGLAFLAWWLRPLTFEAGADRRDVPRDDAGERGRSSGASSGWLPGLGPAEDDSILARGVAWDSARERPLPGVVVTVLRDDVAVLETTAGKDGAFQLVCRPGDLLATRPPGWFRAKAACAKDVILRAIPALGFEGRVVMNGKGVPDARVTCFVPGSLGMTWKHVGVDSGADGRFSITCGVAETRLSAQSPLGAAVFLDLGLQVTGTIVRDVVLELRPGRRIRGRVTDAFGTPVSADMLVLENADAKPERSRTRQSLFLRSDAAGLFELGASYEPHSVTVIASDGRCARADVPPGIEDAAVELVLPEGHELRGRLTGALEGVIVSARRREAGTGEAAAIRDAAWLHSKRNATLEENRFSFSGLEPGKYSLTASSKSASGSTELEVPTEIEPVIHLEPRDYLSVFIHRNGVGETGSVEVELDGRRRVSSIVREGRAELTRVEPGEYLVSFVPVMGPIPVPTHVRVDPGITELTWELSSSFTRVQGTVLDASTGVPIANVEVTPANLDRSSASQHIYPLSLTDESGRFSYAVEDTSTFLFFRRKGYISQAHPAESATRILLTPGTSERWVKR